MEKLIALLLWFLRFLRGLFSKGPKREVLPYIRRQYLLTLAEKNFYRVLEAAAGDRYVIFAQVRLADVLLIRKGAANRQRWLNRINSKHLDFVLCDPEKISPLLGIELDDASHERPDRQERDKFVDEALKVAGLPCLRVPARRSYNVKELAASIHQLTQPLAPADSDSYAGNKRS
jgi:hypothetical protein